MTLPTPTSPPAPAEPGRSWGSGDAQAPQPVQNGPEAHRLPHVRLHSLRHSAAVTMLDASGGDIVAVSKVLGHSTIAVTVDTYSREADAARQRGASYMNKALRRVK